MKFKLIIRWNILQKTYSLSFKNLNSDLKLNI